MNVIDILNRLGWDVETFNGETYTVGMNSERWRRLQKSIEAGECAINDDINYLTDKFEIYVDEVSFNGLGNLFVSFTEVGVTDACFDSYEYRNMSYDELY